MKLYRTTHTGIHAHDNATIYNRQPNPAAETDIYEIDVDLGNLSAGGPGDHPSMVFGPATPSGPNGYELGYNKVTRQITVMDSSGNVCNRISVIGHEMLIAL